MEISTYTPAQLKEFIATRQFAEMPVLPISTHRALSHIANPRAKPDDKILFVAFDNGEMAGYLGVVPDYIYNGKAEKFECGWLSCLWVSPAVRGKGIAKYLLQEVLKTWHGQILLTGFTQHAKSIYDTSGRFDDLRVSKGLNCYLRFNMHEVLPEKNSRYQHIEPILKLVDLLANIPNNLRLAVSKQKYAFKAQFERIYKIDDSVNQFIIARQHLSFERRTATELNWILTMPWVKQCEPTAESKRYYFTSLAERFENLCFKMESAGRVVGIIMLTLRNNHLKVPYVYFENEYVSDMVEHIYKVMREYDVNMLTILHPKLCDYIIKHNSPFIYKRHITRGYLISKELSGRFGLADNIEIQDGDADCAFT